MVRPLTIVQRASTRPVSDRRGDHATRFRWKGICLVEAETRHEGKAMINPLIAYELAKEHQRDLADRGQQRVLAHDANAADGRSLAALVRRAVVQGFATLRRSSRDEHSAGDAARARPDAWRHEHRVSMKGM